MERKVEGHADRGSRLVIPLFIQLMLFQAMGAFCNSSYSPLSPFFISTYHINQATLGLINSVVFLGMAIVSVVSGVLIDRYGSKRLLIIAMLFFITGGLVGGIIHSYTTVLLSFLCIGFGYGVVTPATNRALMNRYAPQHSKRMGVKQTGVSIGSALAALCIPIVASQFGLAGAYVVIGVMGCVGAVTLLRGPKWERKSDVPPKIGDVISQLLKHRSLLFVSFVGFIFIWAQQSILMFYVLSSQRAGFSLSTSELLLFTVLIGAIIGRLLWANGSERLFHGNRALLLALIGGMSGAMLIVLAIGNSHLFVAVLIALCLGATTQAWNGTYVTLVSDTVPVGLVGSASGMSLSFGYMGAILGTPISGAIVDRSGTFGPLWTILGGAMFVVSIVVALVYARRPG